MALGFYGAQTFFVDKSTVGGSPTAYISKVRVWFKLRPYARGNRSGIHFPGVSMLLVNASGGVPDLRSLPTAPRVRVAYNEIDVSQDATAYTDFEFPDLVPIQTGREYAWVLKFEGNDEYELWYNKIGDRILGTSTKSPGPSGSYVGKWFSFVSTTPDPGGPPGTSTSQVTAPNTAVTETLSATWKPSNEIDMKFEVYVSRFRNGGSGNLTPLVSSLEPLEASLITSTVNTYTSADGTINYVIPSRRYEYITFDHRKSDHANFIRNELVWQVSPFYPNDKTPNTVAVANGSKRITSSSVNFSNVYQSTAAVSSDGKDDEYIIVTSKNHGGGNTRVAIRRVESLESNGSILVDEPIPFTNSAAYFYKAPVGSLERFTMVLKDGARQAAMILQDSNANSSVRFVNTALQAVTVNAGGTGYSNSDVLTFTGFESVAGKVLGGANASAVITTNSTGGIVNVYMSNQGAGFTNTQTISTTFANSTGGASAGSGADLVYHVGMALASENSFIPNYNVVTNWLNTTVVLGVQGYVMNCYVINQPLTDFTMLNNIKTPFGTTAKYSLRIPYARLTDGTVLGGWRYVLDDSNASNDVVPFVPTIPTSPKLKYLRILPSWSNEQVIPYRTAGTAANGNGTAANNVTTTNKKSSNATTVLITTTANNDFVTFIPPSLTFLYSKYVISNTYTNENLDKGSALSRGITDKITFSDEVTAEDLKVYLRAWRPYGTDIQVFARIHNKADDEAFDDKDWTRLALSSNAQNYSSQVNETDLIEMVYGFPLWPNTTPIFANNNPYKQGYSIGSITLELGNSVVVGAGTDFSNVVAGDLVRIFDPIFANTSFPEQTNTNHWVVGVESVTNSTYLTLTEPVSNNSLVGSGFKIDKVAYPLQAFNNIQNDNVVRYHTEGGAVYDGFNTVQFKLIHVSTDEILVPKIDDFRVAAVST